MRLTHLAISALAALILSLALMPVAPASAHADYDSSSPSRGEQLAVAPTQVEITFTQELQKIAGSYDITVNKDRGLSVTSGPAVVNDADRTKMSVPLQPNLEDGRYVVNWQNLSDADGDRNVGAFSFYLNHVPTAVDLANDAALEQIGPAETPPAGETLVATAPAGETVEPSQAAGTQTTEPTPITTPSETDDGDSGSNSIIFVVMGVAIVVAIAVGAYVFVRRRSA